MIKRVLIWVGTRPEAIKLAPVCLALMQDSRFEVEVLVSGQHGELATSVLDDFHIPYIESNSPRNLSNLTIAEKVPYMAKSIHMTISSRSFDWVLVHGDTTSTVIGAYLGYLLGVPVAHVEAGLRSGDTESPFPEEANRKIVAVIAKLHFAPTPLAEQNLVSEGVDRKSIYVVGNTVVDAVQLMKNSRTSAHFQTSRDYIIVTSHRRENWDKLESLAVTIRLLAKANPNLDFILPLHPNPVIRSKLNTLGQLENVKLTEPLAYGDFISLLSMAKLVITDSGGIQEEASTLLVPCIILRDKTERPEALRQGMIRLCSIDDPNLFAVATTLISLEKQQSEKPNPFGDGTSASQIVAALAEN